jgi:hypothetical protein
MDKFEFELARRLLARDRSEHEIEDARAPAVQPMPLVTDEQRAAVDDTAGLLA